MEDIEKRELLEAAARRVADALAVYATTDHHVFACKPEEVRLLSGPPAAQREVLHAFLCDLLQFCGRTETDLDRRLNKAKRWYRQEGGW